MAIDVVVVGLGAMGSAAVHALARRGLRVAGIERFEPGHDRGSSHGATRIIRLSYFEHPSYVPLVRRAYALWGEIERASARKLMHVTGIVEAGPPDGVLVKGTLAASRQHDIRHEVLDAPDLMRRFPAFHLPAGDVGVVQPDGGLLAAEPAILTLLQLAKDAGAELRSGETVLAVEPRATDVRVITDRGTLDAGAAVITAGPWLSQLLPNLTAPLRVTRQVIGWFEPSDAALFEPGRFPVFMIESRHGIHYGFPIHGEPGVKVGRHFHREEAVDPDTSERAVSAADEALDPRRPCARTAGRQRPPAQGHDLPLHRDARRRFHHRPRARRAADRGRLALLRSRLQVRAGCRRNPRRPRHSRNDAARHIPVPDCAI